MVYVLFGARFLSLPFKRANVVTQLNCRRKCNFMHNFAWSKFVWTLLVAITKIYAAFGCK